MATIVPRAMVGGSEPLYSSRPDPLISRSNLNRSLTESDMTHDAMCHVDF